MGKAGRTRYELWTAVYLKNENINIDIPVHTTGKYW